MVNIDTYDFGITKEKRTAKLYTLKNNSGMTLCVTDYGATVLGAVVPDKYDNPTDVVLGYKNLSDYETGKIFMGATVGRYAGRIKNATFFINGKEYTINKNDGDNHLHGTLSKKVYDSRVDKSSVIMNYKSLPQDEGYPGTVDITIIYTLNEDNSFSIEHIATTDSDTVLNLINHTYFNLDGLKGDDVLSHNARLFADRFLENDKDTLFTGRILSAKGTPLDFSSFKTIGKDLKGCNIKSGYDHLMLKNEKRDQLFAEVFSNNSGIKLTAFTTCPAFNFYVGYYIDTDMVQTSKNGDKYQRYAGFCLETRDIDLSSYPDFINILKKDEKYYQKTTFKFSK